MGLNVNVYKSIYDCTLNGMTSRHDQLCLINVDGPFNPDNDKPAALLVPGNLPNTVKIIPANVNEDKTWVMFGGNFAYSSDARFNNAVEKIAGYRGAVSIHDRIE